MAPLAVIALALLVSAITTTQSVTVDLIHRDSPRSPFYAPSDPSFDRLHHALRRSFDRTTRMKRAWIRTIRNAVDESQNNPEVVPNGGEYLLNVSIGTPPVTIVAIADTGSDLTWTQCKPCSSCYNQTAPLFDPKKSSTYRHVRCNSTACLSMATSTICEAQPTARSVCGYTLNYGDGSQTTGALSVDNITMGTASARAVSRRTLFGCGFINSGIFSAAASGIIGLGNGQSSIVRQMSTRGVGGRFSYCLLPASDKNGSSKMNFGRDAVVTGRGRVSTPIVSKGLKTFYHLTLKSFSVGLTRVLFHSDESSGTLEGNIIIDSGTTLTVLPHDVYAGLESAVSARIQGKKVKDPQNMLNLCYRSRGDIDAPVITAHFDGGDVRLQPLNTFVRTAKDVVCFAFVPDDRIAIWGNTAQMNFVVGYDLNRKTVSFRPQDCSKL